MSDQPTEKPDAPAPAAEGQDAPATEPKTEQPSNADKPSEETPAAAPATEAKGASAVESETGKAELNGKEDSKAEEPKEESAKAADEPNNGEKADDKTTAEGDTEMRDATELSTAEPDQSAVADTPNKTPAKPQNRRKSAGAGGSSRKSLSKKASKAKMTHLDAKPGDHFLVKLKGFPEWPAIICDESMLPHALLTTRPVTAARPDGTYTEPYADGGKRVYDRNFPVMYLFTNEFGWVVNTALTELTPEMAQNALGGKIRKDLKAAFELAAEQHPLEHYKGILQKFEEEMQAKQEAAQAAAATPKKSKKAKAVEGDEDVDMADAGASSKKNKKRKAEDDTSTPQRTDSAKKPKIKLNTSSTTKNTNGATTQSKDASGKPKTKKSGDKKEALKEKLTPEERLARREKEVKFLRYKLQRGLLSKEHPIKEEEMKEMSDFITMLENLPDLEGSIIRNTSIYKVLKQILKLKVIPRESEFNFKSRSQTLLDKYLKAMAADPAPPAEAPTNGVSKTSEPAAEKKPEASEKEAAEKPADAGNAKDDAENKAEDGEQKTEVEAS